MTDPGEEELTTVAPFRYERTSVPGEEADGEIQWSRISPKAFTPPPGLSRRQRRKYRKAAARDAVDAQRTRNRRAVAAMRGQVGEGFGLPLLVIALVVAGFVFWPRHHAAAPAAPAPSSTSAGASASPTVPAPAGPIGHGTDTGDAPPPPADLAGPTGDVAYRFLLGLNTYDPAFPAPVSTWTASWSQYATSQLAGEAGQLAPVAFGPLAQQRRQLTPAAVTDCRGVGDTGTAVTWECDVMDNLFPIGGDSATPYSQQRWTWRVTVTGSNTTSPRVDTVALLEQGDVVPAPSTAPSPAATPTP